MVGSETNLEALGSFGNLASAVTVAASSFDMKVTDPGPLLGAIDIDKVNEILGFRTSPEVTLDEPEYVEPGFQEESSKNLSQQPTSTSPNNATSTPLPLPTVHENGVNGSGLSEKALQRKADGLSEAGVLPASESTQPDSSSSLVSGKVYMLPDFVDTDALAPNEALSQPNITQQELGTYCLYHTHPDFRQKVKEGQNIVVAGQGFGVGSSREDAVFALQAVGVQCVIAKSFAFIYGRNQPNLGLLGFELSDKRFWAQVQSEKQINIDLDRTVLYLEVEPGVWESFPFQLSQMQRRLMDCGGAEKAFSRYGKGLWQALTSQTSQGNQGANSNGFGILDVSTSKTEW